MEREPTLAEALTDRKNRYIRDCDRIKLLVEVNRKYILRYFEKEIKEGRKPENILLNIIKNLQKRRKDLEYSGGERPELLLKYSFSMVEFFREDAFEDRIVNLTIKLLRRLSEDKSFRAEERKTLDDGLELIISPLFSEIAIDKRRKSRDSFLVNTLKGLSAVTTKREALKKIKRALNRFDKKDKEIIKMQIEDIAEDPLKHEEGSLKLKKIQQKMPFHIIKPVKVHERAFKNLPLKKCVIVILTIGGLTPKDIAKIMKVGPRSIYKHLESPEVIRELKKTTSSSAVVTDEFTNYHDPGKAKNVWNEYFDEISRYGCMEAAEKIKENCVNSNELDIKLYHLISSNRNY